MTTTAGVTCGTYLRISYARAGEIKTGVARKGELLGAEKQLPGCLDLAARKGWAVAEPHYQDDDRSAYSGRPRPEYSRLVADVQAGRIQAIVAWHPDRLTRQPRENEDLIALVERYNIQLVTVVAGEHDLTSPSGRLHFRMLGAISRYESEHRAERVMDHHNRLAKAGAWHGGRRPFGYRYSEGGGLELDPVEALAIRDAAGRILDGGSLTAIAREWRSRGLMATESGRPVTVTRVDRILRSPHLAGVRTHNGERTEATWPVVLDAATQAAVVAILDARGRELRHRGRMLLVPLLVCGWPTCGHVLRGAPLKGKGGKRWPGYRCDASDGGCGRIHRLAKPIEDFTRDAVISALASRALDRERARSRESAGEVNPALLGAALTADRRKLAALELLREDLDDYEAQAARVRERIETAKRQLAAASTRSTLDGLPSSREALQRAWKGWSADRRREVITAAVRTIAVKPVGRGVRFDGREHLDFDWRI